MSTPDDSPASPTIWQRIIAAGDVARPTFRVRTLAAPESDDIPGMDVRTLFRIRADARVRQLAGRVCPDLPTGADRYAADDVLMLGDALGAELTLQPEGPSTLGCDVRPAWELLSRTVNAPDARLTREGCIVSDAGHLRIEPAATLALLAQAMQASEYGLPSMLEQPVIAWPLVQDGHPWFLLTMAGERPPPSTRSSGTSSHLTPVEAWSSLTACLLASSHWIGWDGRVYGQRDVPTQRHLSLSPAAVATVLEFCLAKALAAKVQP